jgi:uncharacterized lipoprotein YajG
MNVRTLGALALVVASAVLGGCATSRSEVKIAPPAVAAAPATKARAVVIQSVRDERLFATAPSEPSTPSLGSEGSGDAVKARAIARKRNGYGQALGDVLLQDGQTVTELVRENIAAAFRQAGYRVANDVASAGPSPLLVDVRIKKFWSWMQPGFVAITMHSSIETDVQVGGGGPATSVSVNIQDSRQIAGDSAWVETVEKALAAYRLQAAGKLQGPPF